MHRSHIEYHGLSSNSLASVVDQSVDCVKLVGLDGTIRYMNPNGLCAMEIGHPNDVVGKDWASLWPEQGRAEIENGYPVAAEGTPVRFRAFCPTAKGSPRWWDVTISSVLNDEGDPAGYLAVSRDVTENQLGFEALDVAAQELRHRLRNTYTMIASLIRGFARGDAQKGAFADEMATRLFALARAQTLFAEQGTSCRLDELVAALVEPFAGPDCDLAIGGLPQVEIAEQTVNAIAIVIGELAVNSSKHGAIRHGGRVSVQCRQQDGQTALVWHESSRVGVENRSRPGGQGLNLIHRIAAARGGGLDLAWHDDGLTATLRFT